MLAMLTMRPRRWANMAGASTWVVSSIERTLTSNMASQSSTLMSSRGTLAKMPALLTQMSHPPRAARACSPARRTSAGARRSTGRPSARSPIVAACSRTRAPWRSRSTRRAPSAAKRVAMAAPMPCAAPVTTTRASAKRGGGMDAYNQVGTVPRAHAWAATELTVVCTPPGAGTRPTMTAPSAAPFVPETESLEELRAAAASCRGCALWEPATQVVFGEGRAGAPLLLVGEQPGDVEDQRGHPFVGPAGKVLVRALKAAGIRRDDVY